MLRVPEPGNVSWQPAGEAPKARKGIEHLEKVAIAKLERSAKGRQRLEGDVLTMRTMRSDTDP